MRIVTFDDEAAVNDLPSRLFGKQPKKDQASLAERLKQANPHLGDVKAIPPGTPIILPDEDEPSEERLVAAVDRIDAALKLAGDAEKTRLEGRRDELLETVRFARIVRALTDPQDEKALDQLNEIDDTLKRNMDEVERRTGELPQRLDELRGLARKAVPGPVSFKPPEEKPKDEKPKDEKPKDEKAKDEKAKDEKPKKLKK